MSPAPAGDSNGTMPNVSIFQTIYQRSFRSLSMSHLLRALITSMLVGTFSTAAQAANVKDVFNGDMLGTTQRHFESLAGVPRQSLGDEHTFRVQGCDITATIRGGNVSALQMALSDKCRADLRT